MTTFWDFFWAMIVFYFIFMVIWIFIRIFADIFHRHDLTGAWKAIWILILFIIPFFGAIVYMITRPVTAQDLEEKAAYEQQQAAIAAVQQQQARPRRSSPRRPPPTRPSRPDHQAGRAQGLRRHHPGRVRRSQGQGTRLTLVSSRSRMARPRSSVAAMIIAATVVCRLRRPRAPSHPPASPAGMPTRVTSVSDGPGFADSFAYGVATAPDGSIVMVGQHLDKDPAVPPGAAAWHSIDGSAWTEVALPQPPHATRSTWPFRRLAGWPSGSCRTASACSGPRRMVVTWARAKALKGGQPQALVATTDGFLVGGQSVVKGVARPVLWQYDRPRLLDAHQAPGQGTGLPPRPAAVGCHSWPWSRTCLEPASRIAICARSTGPRGTRWRFPVHRSGTDVLSAAELGTSGDLFIQVVDTGPAAGPFVGSVWTSPDGLAWRACMDRVRTAVRRGQRSGRQRVRQGHPGIVSGWQRLDRDRPTRESSSHRGPTTLSDGRSLVLDNTNVDPPSVVVQLVPAAAIPASPVPSAAPPAASASVAVPAHGICPADGSSRP